MAGESPVFALQGIGGVYNYGCEAIIRGTAAVLRHRWPECRILYSSPLPEYDGPALSDLGIELVSPKRRVVFVERVVNSLLRSLGTLRRIKVTPYYEWIPRTDVVLSIGGDMFTLMPWEMKAAKFTRAEPTLALLLSGKPVVLWGASVGPFEANPAAKKACVEMLRRMRLLIIRERVTEEYLAGLGLADRLRRVADPAFLMDAENPHAEDDARLFAGRRVLGVNFSPVAGAFAAGSTKGEDLSRAWAAAVARLVKERDLDVLLIPHVVHDTPEDDDHRLLKGVWDLLPKDVQERVTLLPRDLGARRTKWIVSRCTALLAARMHCAVAGLSTGVPTLLLSYSGKAKGMAEYAYGDDRWVLPAAGTSDDLVAAAGRLMDEAPGLRDRLKARIPVFREEALKAADYLAEIVQ